MYRNKKEYEIRYTDVDLYDNLKLSSLLSFMEESACRSADELGFGYSVLQPQNFGFILSNWYVELFRPIKLGDKLRVDTWPVEPKKLIVLRDFEIYIGDEKVGVATSRWCLVDLKTFNLLPSALAYSRHIDYNDFRAVEVTNWKIPRIQSDKPDYVKSISYSDYDHYNHANNTKYADFLLDAFSPEDFKGKFIRCARLSYIKQCKFSEKLEVFKAAQEGGGWILEARCQGELRAQMSVDFNE